MEGEFATIRRLAALFAGVGDERGAGITVAIGDDAAVLAPPAGRELVWTVDAQVEGQHFRRAWLTPEDIGWRSFVAAASDLFAMGAAPWCALSSLALPADFGDLDALARGQAEAARAVGCPIVGGNLSRASELSITTTLLGTTQRAVRRDGARVGDGVWLAGPVGLAAVGLRALLVGKQAAELDAGLAAFRRPVVRSDGGRVLGAHARAAIDLSDGLVQDAGHVAVASRVGILLYETALRAHAGEALSQGARALGEDALDLMLYGGEDYTLLATSTEAMAGFTRVGEVLPGDGVWLGAADGTRRRLPAKGFDHFSAR